MSKKTFWVGSLGGVFLAQALCLSAQANEPVPAEALIGNRADGKALAGQCRTCHGIDGVARIPIAPHIGGEDALYLMRQLTAFRDGTREHEMMTVVTKGLSDQHIADLSAWYSSHEVAASLPPGKAEGDAPEDCTGCHGATGVAEIEAAPNLTAETAMYIDTQLKAFRLGKRQSEVMTVIAEELSDEQIRNFANWYAGTQLKITAVEP